MTEEGKIRASIFSKLTEAKAMGYFDDYGITGNSGFMNGMHINANYSAGKGMVFEQYEDEINGEYWDHLWRRTPEDDADPEKTICCIECGKPAITLDHSWPYLQDDTLCKACFDKRAKIQ